VSASPAGSDRQVPHCTVPDAYTFADHAHRLSRLRLRPPRYNGLDHWASMVAPCLLGCPGRPRQRPVSAARRGFRRPDKMAAPGTRRLLIRGFGVQVPGGAPALTWGFCCSRLIFMCPFCPCGCSVVARQHGPSNPGFVKKRAVRRPMRGHSPRSRAASYGRRRPGSLDRWSRPPARALGARPDSPIPMPSRSVRPAGQRYRRRIRRCRGRLKRAGYLPRDARDSANVRPGGGPCCRRRSRR
jgi:hypothetical protein